MAPYLRPVTSSGRAACRPGSRIDASVRPYVTAPRVQSIVRRNAFEPVAQATVSGKAPTAPDVVAVGEALFDLISDQKGLPRDKVKSWTPYAGGAPCNVVTCLAQLGVKAMFVSALGKDDRGKELLTLIADRGVDISGVQLREEPTRDVYVVRDKTGDREFAGFGLPTEQYSDCFIDSACFPAMAISRAQVLVTGTLGLAYPVTRNAMQQAVKLVQANKGTVLVDINWRPVFWHDLDEARKIMLDYLSIADLVKISDADLTFLYPDITPEQALENPALVAAKLPNAKGVLATAGEQGAAYYFRTANEPTSGFVDVFKVDVADTTGAGDGFTAGFLLQLVRAGGLDAFMADPKKIEYAVRFGAACGALVCCKPGAIAGQPTEGQVLKLLSEH